jgi:FlaA1/EpsC-like NDP-sugar epimerase
MILPRPLQSRTAAFLHDLAVVPTAWLLAYWFRFNLGTIPPRFLDTALDMLPIVVVVQASMFWYFGLYRGIWRFASVPDFVRIAKSVLVGVLMSAALIFLVNRMENIPRSVLPLFGMLMLAGLGGDRLIYRWLKDRRLALSGGRRTLVVGAGEAAEMLVRDMLIRSREYWPVVLADDDPGKIGRDIHGIPVAGAIDGLAAICRKYRVELILIAIPAATREQMRRVVESCEATGIPFRTLPRLADLVSGNVTVNELREVAIEDLLGREPVELDWELIRRGISGRSVLVSGGGGSIGAELCRQIAQLGPARLVIFERSEPHLYRILEELRGTSGLHGVLGDVTDARKLEHAMRGHRPDAVFHAAAFKHVPILEGDVREAVRNNVLGTVCLARAAEAAGCSLFVYISTDKAVNPVNVLGATKRVGEMICECRGDAARTRFVTVRFGNVLGSDGSAVPLFREQIRRGGPVTVTHPDITRYFMTIGEACELILQAGTMGSGGEIFVLDMGQPVRIAYLAEQMIRLSGKQPGADVAIDYVGLRPGEKLYEELFYADEERIPTAHEKILLARHTPFDRTVVAERLRALESACDAMDDAALLAELRSLVPSFATAAPAGDVKVVPFRTAKPAT